MKPQGYYTPGNPKKKRGITREWFERCLQKAFTQDDVIEKIRNLPDKDVVQLYRDWIPRETRLESGISVSLIVHGLENKVKEIEGKVVELKALEDKTK